jgi:hypothetical protein
MRMDELQNVTNTGLTDTEEKLLEVMLNPENRMKSITDICNMAKISRMTYYRAFKKPEFTEVYNNKSKDLIKQAVAPVINTFIREAQRGSFQHGKVILEMAGIYTEKQQMEHTGKDGGPIEIKTMKDEEIDQQIQEMQEKLGLTCKK